MEKKTTLTEGKKNKSIGLRQRIILWVDILALMMFLIAGLLWIGFQGRSEGYFLNKISGDIHFFLGSGKYAVTFLLLAVGFYILYRNHSSRILIVPKLKIFFGIVLILAVFGLMNRFEKFSGGYFGFIIDNFLVSLAGPFFAAAVLGLTFLFCLGAIFHWERKIPGLFRQIRKQIQKIHVYHPQKIAHESARQKISMKEKTGFFTDAYHEEKRIEKKPKKKNKDESEKGMIRNNQLPPLNLLEPEMGFIEKTADVESTIHNIEAAMEEFGTPVDVIGYSIGPGIIQYQVTPGMLEKSSGKGSVIPKKIRVAQVAQRERDLAVRLGVANLSIQAPVPGESFIGIDMPNPNALKVRLRPLIESQEFQSKSSPLSVALGRDISGTPVVVDLEQMPHLLIAGTTNSGKSICLRSMAVCLIMNNTPEQLRIVMIDPKRVELFRFNGLPHLLGKVETEYERSIAVLGWAVQEMKSRYKLFETVGVRKLSSYNQYAEKNHQKPLPYIVIFIDELAEIVKGVDKQGQEYIDTLASLARATGMHLVVATQRPDTTIITGKIKTNIPARIALNVASAIDSRVIMGKQGAEKLLGRGDMYFVDPSLNVPIRIQGPLLTDEEIDAVVSLWKKLTPKTTGEPELAPWEGLIIEAANEESSKDEKVLKDAIRLICRTRKASASYLQVKLNISFPKASRLLEQMEKIGVVGPIQVGGKAREVLWDEDEAESYGEDAGFKEDE